jgi:hypothetical protein
MRINRMRDWLCVGTIYVHGGLCWFSNNISCSILTRIFYGEWIEVLEMSYSRWSDSVWYTYADVHGGFTVCGERNFSDKELEDISACLKFFEGKGYTNEQIEELREYMTYYSEDLKSGKFSERLK